MRKISTLFAKVCFNTAFILDTLPKVWYTVVVPKLVGGYFMAKKWSFAEDYTVCTFCRDEYYEVGHENRLSVLMERFNEAGLALRSASAINQRMDYFIRLFIGSELKNTPKQVQNIFKAIGNQSAFDEEYQRLQFILEDKHRKIKDNGQEYLEDPLLSLFQASSNLIDYTKGDSFQKLLFGFIDERDLSDVEAYTRSEVSRFVFSQIRSNENKRVSKPTALCFCFGLKLTYEQSEVLLKSAGYAFSGFDDFDLLVAEYIMEKKYNIHEINAQLHARNLELLFGSHSDYEDNIKDSAQKRKKKKSNKK